MFLKANNKVKFEEQHLDDYVLQNSVLQCKLQSKVEALSIMGKELDKCRMERDRYKMFVEQLRNRSNGLKSEGFSVNIFTQSHTNIISGHELLANTKEQNNILKIEVETLKNKLEEALADIGALRKQLQLFESDSILKSLSSSSDSNKEYESLVQQLEKLQKKSQQVQLDYRAILDEKEELVADRDYYKKKVVRLHHQMSLILNNQHKPVDNINEVSKCTTDFHSVVTENKFLQERITQLQVEKEIIKRNLTKYKSLLETQRKFHNFRKGIMTQKEVLDFFDTNSKTDISKKSTGELKSLCLALSEIMNDKSIALQHQQKTNQILANRISELEATLESWCNGEKCIPIFPCQMLLDESFVDTDFTNETKEKQMCELAEKNVLQIDNDNELNTVTNDLKYNVTINDKIVLPMELQELVREALADLKQN